MDIATFAENLGLHDAARRAREAGVAAGTVRWNGRLRTCAGRAYCDGAASRIELNPKLRVEGQEAVRATFLHELAHVLTPHDRGHGRAWRAMAASLGTSPERCHSYEAMQRREPRVVAVCTKCGAEIKRRRRLARGRTWIHSRCGGELERR